MSFTIPYTQIELAGFLIFMVAGMYLARSKMSAIFLVFALFAVIGYFVGVEYFTKEIIALVIFLAVAIVGYGVFLKWEGSA